MEVVKVENLYKLFPSKKRGLFVHAVSGINFSIESNETLGLVGESGCGKTTVGRCIVHLTEPTSGRIILLGEDVTKLPEKERRKVMSEAQIVFQEPYDALNPRKVIKQIIEAPLLSMKKLNIEEREKRINEVLEMVELKKQHLNKYPIQLTQGEQQRVGIARAIITRPQLIVLDEPTSLLDIRFRAETIMLLKTLQKETGVSYLFISHDLVVIAQLSHRISVMYLGRIIEEGPCELVFNNPLHPYTRALFAATLFPDPDQKKPDFKLKGEVPSPINLSDKRCNLAPRCPLVKSYCSKKLPKLEELESKHFVACFRARDASNYG
ncbi:oligopeptide/dipeptide ABC transporter ATP-binding protein [Actinomycetota bacterium]